MTEQLATKAQVPQPQRLTGMVTSTKMAKTVTVKVTRRVKHPVYGKYILRSKKYHAHVENITVHDGDEVDIQECRPLSKTKTWQVTRVVRRREGDGS